jgi:hypothetical protein
MLNTSRVSNSFIPFAPKAKKTAPQRPLVLCALELIAKRGAIAPAFKKPPARRVYLSNQVRRFAFNGAPVAVEIVGRTAPMVKSVERQIDCIAKGELKSD